MSTKTSTRVETLSSVKAPVRFPLWAQLTTAFVAVLALWEVSARAGLISVKLFSSPIRIFNTFVVLNNQGKIWENVQVTLYELLVATVIFTAVGIVLGIVFGITATAFEVSYGPMVTLFSFPKVTILPILIMATGLGSTSKVIMGAITGFFPLVIGMMVAVRGIRSLHLELFSAVGAGFMFKLFRLYIPATLPALVSSLRIGFVYAGIGVLLAEMFAATSGLGIRIIGAGAQSNLDQFWVYVICTFLILLTGAAVLRLIEMRLQKWAE